MLLNYNGHANKPGIYMIYNTYSHWIYIGQSHQFKDRWNDYKNNLPKNKCHNKRIQRAFKKAFKKLGHTDFLEFHVLKVMEGSTKLEREIEEVKFIKFFNELGYKICNDVEDMTTFTLFEETEKKRVKNKRKTYNIDLYNSQTGEIIYGPITNLRQLCEQYKIKPSHLYQVINKKRNTVGDWRLLENKDKDFKREKNIKVSKTYNINLINTNTNEIIYGPITNMAEFCKIHGLNKVMMCRIINKKAYEHNGWKLLEDRKPEPGTNSFFNKETGEIVHCNIFTLYDFVKKHDLVPSKITEIINKNS